MAFVPAKRRAFSSNQARLLVNILAWIAGYLWKTGVYFNPVLRAFRPKMNLRIEMTGIIERTGLDEGHAGLGWQCRE